MHPPHVPLDELREGGLRPRLDIFPQQLPIVHVHRPATPVRRPLVRGHKSGQFTWPAGKSTRYVFSFRTSMTVIPAAVAACTPRFASSNAMQSASDRRRGDGRLRRRAASTTGSIGIRRGMKPPMNADERGSVKISIMATTRRAFLKSTAATAVAAGVMNDARARLRPRPRLRNRSRATSSIEFSMSRCSRPTSSRRR